MPDEREAKQQSPLCKKKRDILSNGLSFKPQKNNKPRKNNKYNHHYGSDRENDRNLCQQQFGKKRFQKRQKQVGCALTLNTPWLSYPRENVSYLRCLYVNYMSLTPDYDLVYSPEATKGLSWLAECSFISLLLRHSCLYNMLYRYTVATWNPFLLSLSI